MTSIIGPNSSTVSEILLLQLLLLDVFQIHLQLWILLRLLRIHSKQIPCALRDIQLDLLKDLLYWLANFIEKVSIRIGISLFHYAELFIRLFRSQLTYVDCLYNYSIRNSFSGWKTAAVILYHSHHVIGLISFVELMSEWYNYSVINIVEIFGIEPADKPLQLILDGLFGHFFEDQWGFC